MGKRVNGWTNEWMNISFLLSFLFAPTSTYKKKGLLISWRRWQHHWHTKGSSTIWSVSRTGERGERGSPSFSAWITSFTSLRSVGLSYSFALPHMGLTSTLSSSCEILFRSLTDGCRRINEHIFWWNPVRPWNFVLQMKPTPEWQRVVHLYA